MPLPITSHTFTDYAQGDKTSAFNLKRRVQVRHGAGRVQVRGTVVAELGRLGHAHLLQNKLARVLFNQCKFMVAKTNAKPEILVV